MNAGGLELRGFSGARLGGLDFRVEANGIGKPGQGVMVPSRSTESNPRFLRSRWEVWSMNVLIMLLYSGHGHYILTTC